MSYGVLYKLLLERVPPECAHTLASVTMRAVAAVPGARPTIRRLAFPSSPALQVHALGQTFPSPLGVAAGVDKQASWFEALGAIGFGFVEVGTVTALPQLGEPKPRVVRLPEQRALLNRMGFPNPGAKVFARRLRKHTGKTIVGVNVGKSKVAPLDQAAADYRATVRQIAPFADYVVLNISSPNTPGLRQMQEVELLRPLLIEVQRELDAAKRRVPLLIKLSPDLRDHELDAIADLALERELDGIVAVNTTVDRAGIVASASRANAFDGGGVSGPPLKARALEVLERLYARLDDELVLVSVGGIENPDDAWDRIVAGATLIQANTGFVYGGPGWPARVNRALHQRVHEAGATSIQEVVGAAARARRGGSGPGSGSSPGPGSGSSPGYRNSDRAMS
jgi:dihydroorotate dehydrogenase